jgi:hypothetical protein
MEQISSLEHNIAADKNNMIQAINKFIELATYEINQNAWTNANYHLVNGLNALGFRYKPTNVRYRDDTGMKLIVANDFERKGQLEQAARLRMDILKLRLDRFKSNP